MGDLGLIPGMGRPPGEGNEWQPTPIFLPGEFHRQRSLVNYSSWGCKEMDMTERLTNTHKGPRGRGELSAGVALQGMSNLSEVKVSALPCQMVEEGIQKLREAGTLE